MLKQASAHEDRLEGHPWAQLETWTLLLPVCLQVSREPGWLARLQPCAWVSCRKSWCGCWGREL